MEGKWLSILEYAHYKNKSISTVRRYIKSNRVQYKDEGGKYFIFVKKYLNDKTKLEEEKEVLKLRLENESLLKENRILKEEVAELKMLVQILEQEPLVAISSDEPPQLPQH